jgi:hypothetical protein
VFIRGDGTQRSRAGLPSSGPSGLGPWMGTGLRGSDSCRWCPWWGNINLRTSAEVRSARMLQPLQGCFRFPSEPGVRFATPGYLLRSLRDRGGRPKGLHRNRSRFRLRSRYRERSHRHPLYPTRRGLTRNPTGRSFPHASVSGSVSGSESKTKRSIGIDPDSEAVHPDAALFRWGIAGWGHPAFNGRVAIEGHVPPRGGLKDAPGEGTRPSMGVRRLKAT